MDDRLDDLFRNLTLSQAIAFKAWLDKRRHEETMDAFTGVSAGRL